MNKRNAVGVKKVLLRGSAAVNAASARAGMRMGWCPPHSGSRLALPRFCRQNPGIDQPYGSGNTTRKDSVLVRVRCLSGFRSPAGLRISETQEHSTAGLLVRAEELILGDEFVQLNAVRQRNIVRDYVGEVFQSSCLCFLKDLILFHSGLNKVLLGAQCLSIAFLDDNAILTFHKIVHNYLQFDSM